MAPSLVFGACVHLVSLVDYDIASAAYVWEHVCYDSMSLISGDVVPYNDNQEHPLKISVHCWTFF